MVWFTARQNHSFGDTSTRQFFGAEVLLSTTPHAKPPSSVQQSSPIDQYCTSLCGTEPI